MSGFTLAQAMINGILIGGIYGLVSIGVTLIFGVVKIVNFAHGEFLMLAMYTTFWLWAIVGMDPLLSIVISVPLMFGVGVVVQQALFRRVIEASDLPQIFLTFGLSLLLQNLALLAFSGNVRSVRTFYTDATVNIANEIYIGVPRLIAFAVALALSAGLALFLTRTDIGQAMRAAAQDREVAMLVGINPNHVYRVAVGLAAALAGAAGTLLMPFFVVQPHVGAQFSLIAFAVVIMGTLGDLRGAFIAGLLIGVAESLGIQIIGADSGRIIVFVLLLLTLILRPGGLFGARRV
ncbi:MAG: branched-chain amino acid ABC transporter permease [Chloroflexi bacterium]|nr:branched-chain amino acid ABC transporter permease [Chloroflexota bacterium]